MPADEAPETAEGYEGFIITAYEGAIDRAREMRTSIPDFDRKRFEARKRKMMNLQKSVGAASGRYIELVI